MPAPTEGFAGCHGIRVTTSGAAYGWTTGEPIGTLDLSGEAVPAGPGDAELLWSAEVDGSHRHEMWRMHGGGDLLLRIGGRMVLRVAGDRRSAAVRDVSDAVALQLLSTFAIPLAAQAAGAFVVHAAVAARGDQAVAVCAESGTGKSSLLSALIDAGWAPLTEDLVAIGPGGSQAWPGPPWVRLAPGVPGPVGTAERFRTKDKVAWDLGPNRRPGPAVLTHIVLLDPPQPAPTDLRPAEPAEVIAALARHTPWFEEPSRRGSSLFAGAVRVARTVPASRLRLRRAEDWAADAVRAVESVLA